MKRFLLVGLLLTITAIIGLSQKKPENAKLELGEIYKNKKTLTPGSIIHYDDNGFYSFMSPYINIKGRYFINQYDNSLNLVKTKELEFKWKDNKLSFEFLMETEEDILFFSSFNNRAKEKNYLFVQSYDVYKNTLQTDPRIIAEIDYTGKGKYKSGGFSYTMSRDSSKYLITYAAPHKKGENEKFGIVVLDKELNQIWKKEVDFKIEDDLFEMKKFVLDNNGNVHLLALIFNKKAEYTIKDKKNYKHLILSFFDKGEKMQDYLIDIEDKFPSNLTVATNDYDELICTGLYSNSGKMSISGAFFKKIDITNQKIIVDTQKEFDIKFITKYMRGKKSKKARKKKKKGKEVEMPNYLFKDLILRDDGGAVIIAEQFSYHVVTTYSKEGGTSSNTYYRYNDIVILNINGDGEFSWIDKIPKIQATTNDVGAYSSYGLMVYNDKMAFVYNDDPDNFRNAKYKEDMDRTNPFKSDLVFYEFNSAGESKKMLLRAAGKKIKAPFLPQYLTKVSDNEYIFFGWARKKQLIGRITITE